MYLADTNALVYVLSGNPCVKDYLKSIFHVSVITEMELLSYPKLTDQQEEAVRGLLGVCYSVGLTDEIKNEAIHIRRTYNLKLPDAIIAATAKVCHLPLLSADHIFSRVDGIDFIQLFPH